MDESPTRMLNVATPLLVRPTRLYSGKASQRGHPRGWDGLWWTCVCERLKHEKKLDPDTYTSLASSFVDNEKVKTSDMPTSLGPKLGAVQLSFQLQTGADSNPIPEFKKVSLPIYQSIGYLPKCTSKKRTCCFTPKNNRYSMHILIHIPIHV